MKQTISIEWHPIQFGDMPDNEGTYLVAWSDGTVESYPFSPSELQDGEVKSGRTRGVYWAEPISHPDA